MLIGDAGVLGVKLDVNAVAVSVLGEQFASDSDRCRVGVLSVVNTLRAGESASGKFT